MLNPTNSTYSSVISTSNPNSSANITNTNSDINTMVSNPCTNINTIGINNTTNSIYNTNPDIITMNNNNDPSNITTNSNYTIVNIDNNPVITKNSNISVNTTATQWYLPLQLRCRCSPQHPERGPATDTSDSCSENPNKQQCECFSLKS